MAVTKFLARDLTIEVEDPDSPGSFVNVGGVHSLTHSPSTSKANTSDFNSNGRAEHIVAERGESWTVAGFALEDVETGQKDQGQDLVETLGRQRGPASIGNFRITSPGGNAIVFAASAEVTIHGGATNDAAAWQAVLEVTGEPEYSGPAESS